MNKLTPDKNPQRSSDKKGEERFRAIFDNGPECIKVVDLSGKLLEMNPAGLVMLEASVGANVAGLKVSEFVHPDDLSIYLDLHGEVCNGGSGSAVFRILGLKHTQKWIESNSVPLKDENANVYAVLSVSRDITEMKKNQELLLNNEKRYQALVENGSDVVVILSSEGKPKYISPSVKRILGYSVEEVLDINMFSILHPDDIGDASEVMLDALSTPGIPIIGQPGRVLHKNGTWRWCESIVTNMLQYPYIEGIVNNFRDVTERKLLEDQQKLFVSIVNLSEDAIVSVDLDGVITSWNRGAERLYNYPASEVIGKRITIVIPPDLWEEEYKMIEKVKNGERVEQYETMRIKADGTTLYASLIVSPIMDSKGQITGASKIARDITERKIFEEKLKNSNSELKEISRKLEYNESRLKQAQAIAHVGNWELNFATNISVWSDEAYRIFGMEPSEKALSVEDWLLRVHPEEREGIKNEIGNSRAALSDHGFYHRIVRPDGEIRDIYAESRFEYDANQNPIGLYGVVHDVTERKQHEFELKQLLNMTNHQNKRLQNFSYIVSHNIRSHSVNISGLVGAIAEGQDESERLHLLEMLRSSTGKLSETIENLNEIITVQNDTNLKQSNVRLRAEIEKTRSVINSSISETNTTFINLVPEDMLVKVIPAYLESIILNLITNAVKYKSPLRQLVVQISAVRAGNYIVLSIEDNGIGIDLKKNGDKMFGMYKTFHDNEDSRGFGLYMTRNQLEAMNGRIEVESTLGEGSVFRAYLNSPA